MKAVILAGGYGKRLMPLTLDKPKALVELNGKPMVDWQIEWLKSQGIDFIILLTGYLTEMIKEHLGDGRRFGVRIEYSVEDEPLGTGGALKHAESLLEYEKEFVMFNVDDINNMDLKKIKSEGNVATLALVQMRIREGFAKMNGKKIVNFEEKPLLKKYWVNSGIYRLSSNIFKYLPHKGDIEKTAYPELAKQNLLSGVKMSKCYWHPIDNVKDAEEVSKDLAEKKVYR